MSKHLDRAEKALEHDDASAALAAMLEAWRETRAPVYAKAVDALGAAAAAGTSIPEAKDAHAAWMELAAGDRPDDVGPLIAAIFNGASSTLLGRIEHLLTRPDDPRIDVLLDDALVPVALEVHPLDGAVKITNESAAPLLDVLRNITAPKLSVIRIGSSVVMTDAVRRQVDSVVAERFQGASIQSR